MLRSAWQLFLLRALPWSRFHFPRWQAVGMLVLIALLMGLDPAQRAGLPEIAGRPRVSVGFALASSLLFPLVSIPISLGMLRWWMQRGERWDGQGDLFNLSVASGVVVNLLSVGWSLAGLPVAWQWPLLLYALWVGAKALSGAVPKASPGYSLAGLLATAVPTLMVYLVIRVLVLISMGALGATFPEAA